MRRIVVAIAAGGLLSALVAPGVGARQPDDPDDDRRALELAGLIGPKAGSTTARAPQGPNPYLSLLPDPSTADYAGWKAYGERASAARSADVLRAAAAPIVVEEAEADGARGENDTPDSAEPVDGFGTRRNQANAAQIVGALSPEPIGAVGIPANAEDDGSIPLAVDTGIGTIGNGVTTSGVIGDGPHGSAGSGSGDFDVYAVDAVAGQLIVAETETPVGPLDSIAIVFDASGTLLAANDDIDFPADTDSRVEFTVPTAGTYYVMITGYFALPDDPFDSASGSGAASEGPYDLTIAAVEVDVDVYAVRLRKGDVLGASVAGAAAQITLYDPAASEVMGSTQDATFIYPAASPLPGGGNAVAEHVGDDTGWHFVGVSGGNGDYEITVEAYRPRLDTDRPAQTLFLDFDGARINTGIFGGPGVRTLSPLAGFLAGWGLTDADLDPLIDEIVATVEENLRADMIASGLNDDFRLTILNSRDDADTFGRKNVSRVIVGGTIDESGIGTIGIAQSIDPGNFGTEESALVLLDVLSQPAGTFGDPSLNTYITPASDRIGFIGTAIGNVTAHEAGHFFGNWHVDQFNEANVMDQGGNFEVLFGVGPDGIGGTADDVDVDFGEDDFNPNEGFTGTEDTLSRVVFVLTR